MHSTYHECVVDLCQPADAHRRGRHGRDAQVGAGVLPLVRHHRFALVLEHQMLHLLRDAEHAPLDEELAVLQQAHLQLDCFLALIVDDRFQLERFTATERRPVEGTAFGGKREREKTGFLEATVEVILKGKDKKRGVTDWKRE